MLGGGGGEERAIVFSERQIVNLSARIISDSSPPPTVWQTKASLALHCGVLGDFVRVSLVCPCVAWYGMPANEK